MFVASSQIGPCIRVGLMCFVLCRTSSNHAHVVCRFIQTPARETPSLVSSPPPASSHVKLANLQSHSQHQVLFPTPSHSVHTHFLTSLACTPLRDVSPPSLPTTTTTCQLSSHPSSHPLSTFDDTEFCTPTSNADLNLHTASTPAQIAVSCSLNITSSHRNSLLCPNLTARKIAHMSLPSTHPNSNPYQLYVALAPPILPPFSLSSTEESPSPPPISKSRPHVSPAFVRLAQPSNLGQVTVAITATNPLPSLGLSTSGLSVFHNS